MKLRNVRFLALALCLALLVAFVPQQAFAATDTVSIVHINDIHGNAIGDPLTDEDGKPTENGKIGLARIATYMKQMENDPLFVDAGDTLHGTNFATLSQGENMVLLLNEMGLDAFTPGNHDFNYGSQRLKTLTEEAKFPILAANVTKDGTPFLQENTILKSGDKSIGVFGLATPETKTKSNPVNTEGLVFEDVVETAKEQVAYLNGQNVDAIVMLSHLGMDKESKINTYTVLDAVEGIDVVIDGHSHTQLNNGQDYKGVLIASTTGYGQTFGQVDITFNGDAVTASAKTITFEVMAEYEPDKTISDLIENYDERNQAVLGTVVGSTLTELNGVRENVRAGETNLGNLITDAMLHETDADFVITNGGGIRASIPSGNITVGDILTVLPFGNALTVIEVSGQDVIDAITFGVDAWPSPAGKFPHVAGMSVKIDPSGEKNVVEILLDGKPIDPNAMYTVATNDFMAVGGDGYTMFEGSKQVSLHGLLAEVVENYIKLQDGPLNYTTQGRITAGNRVAGGNRFDTAVQISRQSFDTASKVILANGSDAKLADVLTASPLAALEDAPILLTNRDVIPEVVINEIKRLAPTDIYVVGGEDSVSQASLDTLEGVRIQRFSGATRYETAHVVARFVLADNEATTLYLASGENYADALSLANLASRTEKPILLTRKDNVTNDTLKILALADEVIVAGGENTITDGVLNAIDADVTRVAGETRFETAIEIAKRVKDAKHVAIANGRVVADALAVGPVLADNHQILLLVEKDTAPTSVKEYLKTLAPESLTIYGGPNTVSETVHVDLLKSMQ